MKSELLPGTLDMLVLRVLSRGELHGWGMTERIAQLSRNVFSIGEGSLYPALYRLEKKGWIASRWRLSDNNRKARYYCLTAAGNKQLTLECENWSRTTLAINAIMASA